MPAAGRGAFAIEHSGPIELILFDFPWRSVGMGGGMAAGPGRSTDDPDLLWKPPGPRLMVLLREKTQMVRRVHIRGVARERREVRCDPVCRANA